MTISCGGRLRSGECALSTLFWFFSLLGGGCFGGPRVTLALPSSPMWGCSLCSGCCWGQDQSAPHIRRFYRELLVELESTSIWLIRDQWAPKTSRLTKVGSTSTESCDWWCYDLQYSQWPLGSTELRLTNIHRLAEENRLVCSQRLEWFQEEMGAILNSVALVKTTSTESIVCFAPDMYGSSLTCSISNVVVALFGWLQLTQVASVRR